ncbi:hypothetical protein FY528_20130 [Hymenobacter lutimineralis]|uniref:Uncharacterized protein n=1 Tax=Hymenobacter lutimineralis TaxID=2606448 RepID=A0A5D6UQK0_9BACT|nr:hypothetical protein [Hymenobacter lutimineralis]TYZ05931.1 hypothetical protein FY528_20130 [Hymenobacter lutimineralis]
MSDSAPRPHADEEWENLLRQWREQSAPQPRPYFYSRVRARLISKTTAYQPRRTWVRWPAYAVMLGIVLLLSGDGATLPSADRDAPPETPLTSR